MATTGKKRTTSAPTKRKGSNSKRSNSKPHTTSSSKNTRANTKVSSTNNSNDESSIIRFWNRFKKTRLFKPVMTIIIIDIVVLLNMLFAWNNYTRFFVILGIELIVFAIVSIVRLGLKISSEMTEGDNSGT